MSENFDRTVSLALTDLCDGACSFCSMNGSSNGREKMDITVVDHIIEESVRAKARQLVLFGGEPFLVPDLLRHASEKALISNIPSIIDSNGSFGITPESARDTLKSLNELAKQQFATCSSKLHLSLSLDEFHQKKIPVQSIVNIVEEYMFGDYEFISLQLTIFSSVLSQKELEKFYLLFRQKGLLPLPLFFRDLQHEDIERQFIYLAYPEEIVSGESENRARLQNMFPEDVVYVSYVVNGDDLVVTSIDLEDSKDRKFHIKNANPKRVIPFSGNSVVVAVGRGKYLLEKKKRLGKLVQDNNALSALMRQNDHIIVSPQGLAYPSVTQLQLRRALGVNILGNNIRQILDKFARNESKYAKRIACYFDPDSNLYFSEFED